LAAGNAPWRDPLKGMPHVGDPPGSLIRGDLADGRPIEDRGAVGIGL